MKNIEEFIKFVKIDNTFYTVLLEYEKNGNKEILIEKIVESLFFNYNPIQILTDNFQNKKNLDLFIGEKNEQIFKNLRKRLDKSDLFKLSEFINNVIFNSSYSSTKKANILKELEHLMYNTRRTYNVPKESRERALHIYNKVCVNFDNLVINNKASIEYSDIKWIDFIKHNLSDNGKLFLINTFVDIFYEKENDTSKLSVIRDFLYELIKKEADYLDDDIKFKLVKLFKYSIDNLFDRDTSNFGKNPLKFNEKKFYNVLTILYSKDIPNDVYFYIEDFVVEKLNEAINNKVIGQTFDVLDNFHLFFNQDPFKEYIRKYFEESFEFVEFYKKATLFLNEDRLEELKEEYSEKIGSSYYGKDYVYIFKYPLKIKNISMFELFSEYFSAKQVVEHINKTLTLDFSHFEMFAIRSDKNTISAKLLETLYKTSVNEEEVEFLVNWFEGVLRSNKRDIISRKNVIAMYKFFFEKVPLLSGKSIDTIWAEYDSVNYSVVDFAKEYQKYSKDDFRILVNSYLSKAPVEVVQELFLTYYQFQDLKDFQTIATHAFVVDADSFKRVVKLFEGKEDFYFIRQLIDVSDDFLEEVIHDLLDLSQKDFSLLKNIIDKIVIKKPELINVVQDYSFENVEIQNKVFNYILKKTENIHNNNLLPSNIDIVDNKKRERALSILKKAINELF